MIQLYIYISIVAVVYSLSHIQLFVTPWTVAHQAALSMGFPRQELWSGLPCPSPYISVHIFFTFSSIIGYYKILSRVPCAIQWVLIDALCIVVYIF